MKRITLKKENESLVYYGGTFEDIGWGAVQFPKLYNMKDGRIGMSVHDGLDSWVDLVGDAGEKWFITDDKGKSWRLATQLEVNQMGTILPSGDIIRSQPNPIVSIENMKPSEWEFCTYHIPSDDLAPQKPSDPNQLPVPICNYADNFKRHYDVYWLDSFPDGFIDKNFRFYRLKNGETEGSYTSSRVDWKYRTTCSFDEGGDKTYINGAGIYVCRDVKVAPDGSLFLAHYCGNAANPYNGVYQGTTNCYFLRSTDNGESWQLQGYIPYIANEVEDNPFAHLVNGYDEPTIEFMDDGSVICIIRTCDVFKGAPEWGPTYISRSADMCKTWSKPERFADIGALPQLVKLPNGITLAVITRPGIFIYATRDGVNWTEPFEIMTGEDRSHLGNLKPERPNFHQWAGSCCNCTIVPTGDNRAMLAFSDFYVPGDDGLKHKGVKTIEIIAD